MEDKYVREFTDITVGKGYWKGEEEEEGGREEVEEEEEEEKKKKEEEAERNWKAGNGSKTRYVVGSYHVAKLFGYRRFFDVETASKSG